MVVYILVLTATNVFVSIGFSSYFYDKKLLGVVIFKSDFSDLFHFILPL